jgi:alpha-1,6-mannosyltransferase
VNDVSRDRFILWLRWQDGAGLVCAMAYGVLAWFSRQPEFLSLWAFYALLAVCLLSTLLVFGVSSAASLTVKRVVLWAICFRLIALFGDPLWEDDYFRYLWDGYRFFESGTPYGIAPADFFGDGNIPQAFQQLLARINYPTIPTIYGPTTEYSFLLAHWLSPAKIGSLQLLYSMADIALVCLLLKLANSRWVLLYAWSPLVLKEVAFTAHPDGLGAMLLMVALYCRYQQQFAFAVVFLALSVGAKVFALLLVPFVLFRLSWRYWLLFGVSLAMLYGPFVYRGSSDMAGLLVFAREWQFNGSAYELVVQWLQPLMAKLILGVVFLALYCRVFIQFCRKAEWEIPRGDILFGLFFFVAPVVNAWYLLWLLPFAVIYPSQWSWTFSVTVLLSYAIGINIDSTRYQPFELPLWVQVVEYGLVLLVLLWEQRLPLLARLHRVYAQNSGGR